MLFFEEFVFEVGIWKFDFEIFFMLLNIKTDLCVLDIKFCYIYLCKLFV